MREYLTAILLIFPFIVCSQSLTLSGKVDLATDNRDILPKVSITISDSSQNKSFIAASDSAGYFHFRNLPKGNYSMIASPSDTVYEEIEREIKLRRNENINLILKRRPLEIEEVIISKKQKMITMVGDRMDIKPDMLIGYDSDNAFDLLGKVPGIWTDLEKIKVNGSDETTVLLNGKKQVLSNSQLSTWLKAMRANQIEKIEIYSGGSVKYDASGGAVINIITKKSKIDGVKINLGAELIVNDRIGTSNNILADFKKKKLQMQLSYTYRNNFQNYADAGRVEYFDQALRSQYERTDSVWKQTNLLATTLNYDFNQWQSLSFSLNATKSTTNSYSNQIDRYQSDRPFNLFFSRTGRRSETMISSYLDYEIKFDTLSKKKINFSYGILNGSLGNDMNLNSRYIFQGESDSLVAKIAAIPLSGLQHRLSSDFTYSFGQSTLEAGLKYSSGHINNYATYFDLNGEDVSINYADSDSLKYKENVSAGYVSFAQTVQKLHLQAGLRLEHSKIENFNLSEVLSARNSYTNVLPHFSVNYTDRDFSLALKFASGLTRPDYTYLNPYKLYVNEFRYRVGNGMLKPQIRYTTSIEASPTDFLFISVGYNRINDMIFVVNKQSDNPVVIEQRPENALALNDYFVNLSIYYKLWNGRLYGQLNGYGELFNYDIKKEFITSPDDLRTNTFGYLAWNNSIKVSDNIVFEHSINLRSKADFYQVFQDSRWRTDLGLTYKPNKRLNIYAKVEDVFSTYDFSVRSYYDSYENAFSRNMNQFKVRFGVTYTFNKGILGKQIKRKTFDDVERFSR